MRILKIFVFLFTTVALAQKAPLTDSEISSFKKGVAVVAQNMETLSSDFTQVKYIQLMEDKTVSKGKLYYKSPNILKWEYHTPFNYKILFKENKLSINDDGDKSVTSLSSNKLFEKLISLISGSVNGKLLADNENFDVSYRRSGNYIAAIIVPRDPTLKQMFSEIIMVFNKDFRVDSVRLMEEEGDFTQIEFNNILMNPNLENAVFQN